MGMRSSKVAVGPSMRSSPVLMLTTWPRRIAALKSAANKYLGAAMLLSNPDQHQTQGRHQRHREEHPWNARHLFPRSHAEQNQRGVKFDASAHQIRIQHIILEDSVNAQKHHQP